MIRPSACISAVPSVMAHRMLNGPTHEKDVRAWRDAKAGHLDFSSAFGVPLCVQGRQAKPTPAKSRLPAAKPSLACTRGSQKRPTAIFVFVLPNAKPPPFWEASSAEQRRAACRSPGPWRAVCCSRFPSSPNRRRYPDVSLFESPARSAIRAIITSTSSEYKRPAHPPRPQFHPPKPITRGALPLAFDSKFKIPTGSENPPFRIAGARIRGYHRSLDAVSTQMHGGMVWRHSSLPACCASALVLAAWLIPAAGPALILCGVRGDAKTHRCVLFDHQPRRTAGPPRDAPRLPCISRFHSLPFSTPWAVHFRSEISRSARSCGERAWGRRAEKRAGDRAAVDFMGSDHGDRVATRVISYPTHDPRRAQSLATRVEKNRTTQERRSCVPAMLGRLATHLRNRRIETAISYRQGGSFPSRVSPSRTEWAMGRVYVGYPRDPGPVVSSRTATSPALMIATGSSN